MADIIWMLLALAVVFAIAKVAVIFLLVAGLIFRTKETLSLLFLLFFLGLIDTHPWAAAGILAFAIFGSVMKARHEAAKAKVPQLPPPPQTQT